MNINRIDKPVDLPSTQAPEQEKETTTASQGGIADASSQIENPVQNAMSEIWNNAIEVSPEGKSLQENPLAEDHLLDFEKKKAEVSNMYDSVSQSVKSKFDKLMAQIGDNPEAVRGLQLDLQKELNEVEVRKGKALAQLENVKQEALQNSDSIDQGTGKLDFSAWRLGGSE